MLFRYCSELNFLLLSRLSLVLVRVEDGTCIVFERVFLVSEHQTVATSIFAIDDIGFIPG